MKRYQSYSLTLVIFTFVCEFCAVTSKTDVFVDTNYGTLRGFQVHINEKCDGGSSATTQETAPSDATKHHRLSTERPASKRQQQQQPQRGVNVFLGVPFARPPIDELRFEVSEFLKNQTKITFLSKKISIINH